MMRRFLVKIHWPPQGRERYGHGYNYLVLTDTAEQAVARVEARWHGKQGGATPHTIQVVGVTETDLFELSRIPTETT